MTKFDKLVRKYFTYHEEEATFRTYVEQQGSKLFKSFESAIGLFKVLGIKGANVEQEKSKVFFIFDVLDKGAENILRHLISIKGERNVQYKIVRNNNEERKRH